MNSVEKLIIWMFVFLIMYIIGVVLIVYYNITEVPKAYLTGIMLGTIINCIYVSICGHD